MKSYKDFHTEGFSLQPLDHFRLLQNYICSMGRWSLEHLATYYDYKNMGKLKWVIIEKECLELWDL